MVAPKGQPADAVAARDPLFSALSRKVCDAIRVKNQTEESTEEEEIHQIYQTQMKVLVGVFSECAVRYMEFQRGKTFPPAQHNHFSMEISRVMDEAVNNLVDGFHKKLDEGKGAKWN